MKWLRHAFAIDPPTPAEPDEAERTLVDAICREVVRRRMVSPAMLILEMGRPLNYVSAQLLHFLQPLVTVLADEERYDRFAAFLERRGSIDYICRRLEAAEAAAAVPRTPAER